MTIMNPWLVKPESPPVCSPATLKALEARRVLHLLGTLCRTDLGQRWVDGLVPTDAASLLTARRADVDLVGELSAKQGLVNSATGLLDILAALSNPKPALDGLQIRQLALGVTLADGIVRRLGDCQSTAPIVVSAVESLELAAWSRKVLQVLDEHGEVHDKATPRLQSLVSSTRSQRADIRKQLERYIREQADTVDDTVTLREGRMTVLMRAASAEASEGVRHGSSGSGHSVYMEPLVVVEANNKLRKSSLGAEQERRRILREILDFVAAHRAEMIETLQWLGQIDGIEAIASWRGWIEGCWAEVSPDLHLQCFRHPLLDQRLEKTRLHLFRETHVGSAEPLSLTVESEKRLLVITGPNAVGKTVAIKTVGLAAMLNQCGIPLPADSARLPLFDLIEAVVGDDQDLMTAKSTFSGRLERLRDIWQHASESSLVAIDELGSGTDPEEGSALAVALLEEMAERGTIAVVTTHLMPLASFAGDHSRGSNAAMVFDSSSGEPTYQLRLGPPGESHALDLARRLRLPGRWLQRAEELVGSERVSLSQMISSVEVERLALERKGAELEQRTRQVEAEKAELSHDRTEALRSKERFSVQMRRRQDEFERKALRRIDQGLRELERRTDIPGKKISKSERGKILAQATEHRPAIALPSVSPVEVGDKVRHRVLSWSGTVVATKGKQVQVAAGGKKIWVPPQELVAVEQEVSTVIKSQVSTTRESDELHLLGYTVDDALDTLDDYLSRAHSHGLDRVRIIHGHGSGRLRKAVRDFVRNHHVVAQAEPAPPAEGGNGATILSLAD